MSENIQQILIVAVALAVVVIVALVLKRRLSIKLGKNKFDTGEHSVDQRATTKGPGSLIENAEQKASVAGTGSQTLDARGGGQVKGVRQAINDPGARK